MFNHGIVPSENTRGVDVMRLPDGPIDVGWNPSLVVKYNEPGPRVYVSARTRSKSIRTHICKYIYIRVYKNRYIYVYI